MDPGSIDWERVRRLTVVPFLADGRCALIRAGDSLALPSGEVLAGEDPALDTALRVPLLTAGFRRQGLHPLAVSGGHAAVWSEGDDGYRGTRPHAEAELWKGPPAEAARRLRAAGDEPAAGLVEAADRARREQDDESFYRDHLWLLETSYLRSRTPRGGSGFGGTAAAWRAQRGHLGQAIERDGSFLDVGCANGHLVESMVAWCAEAGVRLEPYGVDLSTGLVAEARRRLPRWADRIWVGNALDWTAPGGRRFDYVHTLLDLVPEARLGQMVRHQLHHLVAPGGRLLVSSYVAVGDRSRHADAVLRRLGFPVDGRTTPAEVAGRGQAPSAWIERRQEPRRWATMPGSDEGSAMAVQLNHTIVRVRDKRESATFLADVLGLAPPTAFGPFLVVEVDNQVSLDFADDHGPVHPQHYAFLVGEDEFDEIFGRIRDRGLDYWADPGRRRPGEINTNDGGRGVYWEDPSGHFLEIITRPYGSGP